MKIKLSVILLLAFLTIAYAKSNDDRNILESFSFFYITSKDGKAIYKEPNINSEKICIVPYGTKVVSTKIAIKELWYYVEWKNYKGWTSDKDLSESEPLRIEPENTDEIKLLITEGSFSQPCGIYFVLDKDGSGGGGYDHCAGGEASKIKKLTWTGNNPFYVTIVTSTPIGSDSFHGATSYTDSTSTIVITYIPTSNSFITNIPDLAFKYKSKP